MADNRAIRTAQWTLAEVDGAGWELFHTPEDPFENVNVAAKHPEVVAELEALWLKWWQEESGTPTYSAQAHKDEHHYKPQGDRGSGALYVPSAMPAALADKYPLPGTSEAAK
jgi:arylsulfatase